MSDWNGLSLQTDFSETLGDTSTAFKTRVLGWMNQVQDDISARFQWPFLRKSGKKLLSTTSEYQDLNIASPGAPTIATAVGGSLTNGSTYAVAVTFYQSQDEYETLLSTVSSTVTCNTPNLQVNVTGIPTSTEPLVTSRRIYLSKDGGNYYFSQEITNNSTTTATITTDTTSTVQAPDYIGIKFLLGDPWLEVGGSKLIYRGEDDLRTIAPTTFPSGQPQFYGSVDYSRICVYPKPSSALTLRFNYIRIPKRIFAALTSQPTLPIWMRPVFELGVLAQGYQYRERQLALPYMQMYEKSLAQVISQSAKPRVGAGRIRDVVGNSDGDIY
jgi:hypothetical protein